MNPQTKPSSAPILLTGGTGKVGRRVAALLAARGVNARVATRPAFDWNRPERWDAALEGVSAAYLGYAPDLAIPGATDTIRAFVDRATARGVERLVLLSGRGEAEAQACERIVQASGVAWTVVRASWFMQNFSEGEFGPMVREGAITLPAADIAEPFVDVNDIAAVVVAALTGPGHDGEVYEVTGPEALTFTEAAAAIARAAGRDIPFVRVPRDAFAHALDRAGVPPEVAWLLDYLFGTVLDGRNTGVCDGVERALGRPPARFDAFARRIAARGTWDPDERVAVA